jgi:hypothetical protein
MCCFDLGEHQPQAGSELPLWGRKRRVAAQPSARVPAARRGSVWARGTFDERALSPTVRGMKRTAALVGAALILFALGFSLARKNWPDTRDRKGAPTYTYSTSYTITRWEVRPAAPPSPLDGSDLPANTAPPETVQR